MAKKPKSEGAESNIAATGPQSVPLLVPCQPGGLGHCQRHLDLQLSPPQATTLRAVFDGLYAQSARFACGAPIKNAHDVIRWLLEQLAAGIQH